MKKHAVSKEHQQNMSPVKETRTITQMLTHSRHVDQVKQAEIKMAVRHTKCSLIIDKSTDIASKKQLAVVRFYCDRELKVRSHFFKLVEVTHSDAVIGS